jgi:acetolactate decarboxylase
MLLDRRMHGCLAGCVFAIVVLTAAVPGFAQVLEPKDTLFQVSTLTGLERGVFYPVTTVGDLRQHGNTGVGAFEAMDGELILLDGKAYNAMYEGKVVPVEDPTPITYSAVAFLNADNTVPVKNIASYAQLQQSMDKLLPNLNIFYVFKLQGTFNYLKAPHPAATGAMTEETVALCADLLPCRPPEPAEASNTPARHWC